QELRRRIDLKRANREVELGSQAPRAVVRYPVADSSAERTGVPGYAGPREGGHRELERRALPAHARDRHPAFFESLLAAHVVPRDEPTCHVEEGFDRPQAAAH